MWPVSGRKAVRAALQRRRVRRSRAKSQLVWVCATVRPGALACATPASAAQALALTGAVAPGEGPPGALLFELTDLHKAGPFTLRAEWNETRPGLPAAKLRTDPINITVCAGACAHVDTKVANESMATLAAGNGAAAAGRLVLRKLRVQLLDEFDNKARCAGAEAKVRDARLCVRERSVAAPSVPVGLAC